jgi:DNA-binding transcriptional ArsR family regulator
MPSQSDRLPAPIWAALAECALLPIKPAHARTLAELLRCTPATDPARRFRVTVGHLCDRLDKSDSTVDRYLAALRADGWIEREQSTTQARRHGWRAAWTWLTAKALDALGLQRGSFPAHDTKPCSKGEAAWRRVRRIPQDLAALADKIGAARVCWLMAEARRVGRRVQDVMAGALQADSPAGFILRALRGKAGSAHAPAPGQGGAGPAPESRQDARAYLDAHEKAGTRTAAGRLAGLEMLRARFSRP